MAKKVHIIGFTDASQEHPDEYAELAYRLSMSSSPFNKKKILIGQ
jgi:hypothetical protein